MNQNSFRSIWLSDTHLGSKHVNSEYLLHFLENTEADYLYLVGDIIDFWKINTKKYWPQINNHIIRNVLRKARSGTKVIYIPGNHDEIMRDFCGQVLHGVHISQNVIHKTVTGKKFLVTHGDEFDSITQSNQWLSRLGSFAYEFLLAFNTLYNRLRSILGYPYWSFSAYLKNKVKQAVKFISKYEEVVSKEAKRRKVDGFICGHIHQAACKNFNGIAYNNTGDWVESCSAITEDFDGVLNIVHWRGQAGNKTLGIKEGLYENCYSDRRLVAAN